MYVNEMLYNFWGPDLVEKMDKLSWAQKSLEENQPKINFDRNKIHFEEWLQEHMLSIYNAAQMNARYDSKLSLIKDKLCLLFDDYLHRMSMLTDRDDESFRESATNWVKSTKWSINTLLTEYESMKDLPHNLATGDRGKKTRETRMAVNRDVRKTLDGFLSNMQEGSLSSMQSYRKMKPAPFYSKGEKMAWSMSHGKKDESFAESHNNSNDTDASKAFKSCNAKLDLKKLMNYLHSRMDGKSDVEAFKYIHVAVTERFIERPEVTVVRREFDVKGDKTTYNDYVGFLGNFANMKKHQGALEAIKIELHSLLDEKTE